MKALTITQPWASLIVDGRKHWETRSWHPTLPSGPFLLAIHAAKGWTASDREFAGLLYGDDALTLPRGSVVAIATVTVVVRTEAIQARLDVSELALGDYTDGRYAWRLDRVQVMPQPVPRSRCARPVGMDGSAMSDRANRVAHAISAVLFGAAAFGWAPILASWWDAAPFPNQGVAVCVSVVVTVGCTLCSGVEAGKAFR